MSDGRLIIIKTNDTQCFTNITGGVLQKICQPIAGLRRENDERKLTGQTNFFEDRRDRRTEFPFSFIPFFIFLSLDPKDTFHVVTGLAFHLLGGDSVGVGEALHDKGDEGGLVALAAMRNRSHVRTVSFKDDALKGDGSREVFGQMTFLEREHATNA